MQFFSGRSAYDKLVQSTYKSSEERDLLIAEVRAQSVRPTQAVALFCIRRHRSGSVGGYDQHG